MSIFDAAKTGDTERVQALIMNRADVKEKDDARET